MKSYTETIDYLFAKLPMFQRVGNRAFKKGLDNIQAFCDYLGNPQNKFKSIHIAGTNGKGSTAHLIAGALQAKGLKTGLYTSPHYRDFRERIKINGCLVPELFVQEFVHSHQQFIESLRPSFFEITVAMAFEYFASEEVEYAVVETGLGGIFDSTNIILPVLSVITNISFDHQDMLGDTLPEIAASKAGIIKKNTPVIIGEEQEEVRHVFEEKAGIENAPVCFASAKYKTLLKEQPSFNYSVFHILKSEKLWLPNLKVNLSGNYQARNVVTAVAAIDLLFELNNWQLDHAILSAAWENLKNLTHFKGRWEVLGHSPLIICDCAHNLEGLRLVLDEVAQLPYDRLHMVIGMVNDKDVEKMLKLFPPHATYYFAKANVPRGMNAQQLMQTAQPLGLKGMVYPSVEAALSAAKENATQQDVIFVGGSSFVVAEVV